jgi:hypothetical protein
MPAVRVIARAPQNVSRKVGIRILAPPALAPIAQRSARKINEPRATIGSKSAGGETRTSISGAAAPTEKVAADASAACTGRAVLISEIPSSSRAWAPSASFAISWRATWCANPTSRPRATYILASSSCSACRLPASSCFSRDRSARSVSDCELTETYSPAAIDIAPATNPATPVSTASLDEAAADATPRNQTGRRNDPIIGTQNSGTEPSNSRDEMVFLMNAAHG